MGQRRAVAAAVAAVLVLSLTYLWARAPVGGLTQPVAIPRFTGTVAAPPPSASNRATLLPTDCADLLAGGPDMSALLAQPVDSVTVRAIIGQPSPSVGQLERVTCNYTLPGRPTPQLVLTLSAFTTPEAAAAQRDRNLAAEGSDVRATEPAVIGAARGSVLREADGVFLLVAYDRYTVAEDIQPGVAPGGQDVPVLTDLAQRVLANLAPPGRRR